MFWNVSSFFRVCFYLGKTINGTFPFPCSIVCLPPAILWSLLDFFTVLILLSSFWAVSLIEILPITMFYVNNAPEGLFLLSYHFVAPWRFLFDFSSTSKRCWHFMPPFPTCLQEKKEEKAMPAQNRRKKDNLRNKTVRFLEYHSRLDSRLFFSAPWLKIGLPCPCEPFLISQFLLFLFSKAAGQQLSSLAALPQLFPPAVFSSSSTSSPFLLRSHAIWLIFLLFFQFLLSIFFAVKVFSPLFFSQMDSELFVKSEKRASNGKNDQPANCAKVVMLGDSGGFKPFLAFWIMVLAGKTAILTQFFDENFEDGTQPTIGIDFRHKMYKLADETVSFLLFFIPSFMFNRKNKKKVIYLPWSSFKFSSGSKKAGSGYPMIVSPYLWFKLGGKAAMIPKMLRKVFFFKIRLKSKS